MILLKKRKPWRHSRYRRRACPLLQKMLLALLIVEFGVLAWQYYEPGWVRIGIEQEEDNPQIFIRIYYE